jgi:dUTP pyrophosphatase
MEEDEVLYICNRSSGPKKLGLVLANSIGVIDADYADNPDTDGEIMFAFYNFFPFDITIKKGDKIGQGIFQKFLRADNARIGGDRVGGFGSTDNVSSGETVQPSTGGVNLSKESEQSKFSGLEGLGEYTTGKFASFGTGTQEEDNTQNQTTFHLEK